MHFQKGRGRKRGIFVLVGDEIAKDDSHEHGANLLDYIRSPISRGENSMPIQHVDQLARALHEAGVVNLDTKISDVLKVAGVGELTPGSKVASGAVAAAF
jgi:hypothetical protein